MFTTLYEWLGIDVATTQFTDLAGRPQYLVSDHRPRPELIGERGTVLWVNLLAQSDAMGYLHCIVAG